MPNEPVVQTYRDGDYEAILSAVTETHRGRWFLEEHAHRHRGAETEIVVSHIAKLGKLLQRERRPDADRIKLDIGEMKDAIEQTKREIANIKVDKKIGSRFIHASNELDAIISQTEAATSEILENAEKIQELCFTAREEGVPTELCDKLEEYVTTIYLGCSFQDLTGQRTQKVVHVLRFLEARIDSMMAIWGMDDEDVQAKAVEGTANPMDRRPDAHLLNGPQLNGEGVNQSLIDTMLDEDAATDLLEDMNFVSVNASTEDIDAMDFDSVNASAEDIDAMDFDSISTSDETATDEASLPSKADDAPHHETQAEVDEMFADAAFERVDREQVKDYKANDTLAKMKPKERRALFS